MGTVLWKQAESGPRPQREPHPTKGAPPQGPGEDSPFSARWALSAGFVLGDGRQGSAGMEGGVVGTPSSSAAGDSGPAPPATTALGSSTKKYFLGLRWLGVREGKELREGSRLANPVREPIQGPFCPLRKGSFSLDAPSIAS